MCKVLKLEDNRVLYSKKKKKKNWGYKKIAHVVREFIENSESTRV